MQIIQFYMIIYNVKEQSQLKTWYMQLICKNSDVLNFNIVFTEQDKTKAQDNILEGCEKKESALLGYFSVTQAAAECEWKL